MLDCSPCICKLYNFTYTLYMDMMACSPCTWRLYNFTYTLYMDMFYCSPCTWRSCWNISRESTRPPHMACLPLLRCRGCSLGQEPDDRHGQDVYDRHGQDVYERPGLRVYDHGDDGDVHHGQDVYMMTVIMMDTFEFLAALLQMHWADSKL